MSMTLLFYTYVGLTLVHKILTVAVIEKTTMVNRGRPSRPAGPKTVTVNRLTAAGIII